MALHTIQGSAELARKIRQRRLELGLTIEEAALRAGVGMKTWNRYEAGESIRQDKFKGVCKAMNWQGLSEKEDDDSMISIDKYRSHKAWSVFLEESFGEIAAMSFAIGSDILSDHIEEDLHELSVMPKGSHIGQINISWLSEHLPEPFRMYYDYDFLYLMKCTLDDLVMRANAGRDMTAHSVLEELIIYLCNEEAESLLEFYDNYENWIKDDWVFDLFDDSDLLMFLYSNWYLETDHPYHFSNWKISQFYTNSID